MQPKLVAAWSFSGCCDQLQVALPRVAVRCVVMVRDQKRSLHVPKGTTKSRKRAYGSVELSRLITKRERSGVSHSLGHFPVVTLY